MIFQSVDEYVGLGASVNQLRFIDSSLNLGDVHHGWVAYEVLCGADSLNFQSL